CITTSLYCTYVPNNPSRLVHVSIAVGVRQQSFMLKTPQLLRADYPCLRSAATALTLAGVDPAEAGPFAHCGFRPAAYLSNLSRRVPLFVVASVLNLAAQLVELRLDTA